MQFIKSLSTTLHIWAGKHQSLTPETQTFDVTLKTCFARVRLRVDAIDGIAKFDVRTTTAQLYPDRDVFDFDQGHVTKNQPVTVLTLLSENLAI